MSTRLIKLQLHLRECLICSTGLLSDWCNVPCARASFPLKLNRFMISGLGQTRQESYRRPSRMEQILFPMSMNETCQLRHRGWQLNSFCLFSSTGLINREQYFSQLKVHVRPALIWESFIENLESFMNLRWHHKYLWLAWLVNNAVIGQRWT